MLLQPIEPREFVDLVSPLLARQDLHGLCALLNSRWEPDQLRQLLHSSHLDALKIALLALALVGKACCVNDLAEQLKSPDPIINELAEHALWSVWLRSGRDPETNHLVCRGNEAMNQRDFEAAIDLFSHAIRREPDFAEAYNQRAIAYYLDERFKQSVGDCKRTVCRMPCHFGAWAGMGHCHTNLNQIPQAIESYEHALQINPHLSCVRQSIAELKKR